MLGLWNLLSTSFNSTNLHEVDKWLRKIFTKKVLIEANTDNAKTRDKKKVTEL